MYAAAMPALLTNHQTLALSTRDGRTRQARLVRLVRRELEAHVGGNPTTIQRLFIERAAQLSLVLAELDAQAATQPLTGDTLIGYLSIHGHLARALERLGIKPHKDAETKPDTVAALLERLSA
jgi:hypothetical protein